MIMKANKRWEISQCQMQIHRQQKQIMGIVMVDISHIFPTTQFVQSMASPLFSNSNQKRSVSCLLRKVEGLGNVCLIKK